MYLLFINTVGLSGELSPGMLYLKFIAFLYKHYFFSDMKLFVDQLDPLKAFYIHC